MEKAIYKEVKMNISPVANELIIAINNFKEESSKTGYRFTIEEQIRLEREITILQNHINLLIDYELKKEKEEN